MHSPQGTNWNNGQLSCFFCGCAPLKTVFAIKLMGATCCIRIIVPHSTHETQVVDELIVHAVLTILVVKAHVEANVQLAPWLW